MDTASQTSKLPWARPIGQIAMPEARELALPDGYRTSVYVHRASAASDKLPVVYLHGIQSHPGWFGGSAAHMASCGHEVWQATRRGSGLNAVDRGHADSARQLVEDVEAACQAASHTSGDGAVHLVGVSWGGKLAACYACSANRRARLASLTLIAPGIVPTVDVNPAVKLAIGISLLCCPRRRFRIPLSDVGMFTDNEQMREYLRQDAFRLHRATARFLMASAVLGRELAKSPGCIDVPTTLVLASRDRIIQNRAAEQAVRELDSGCLEVITLQGCHTLEFEEDPTPLYGSLSSSLDRGERA
jgi:alpha-beta hydrolase superfamily lysophospholipase